MIAAWQNARLDTGWERPKRWPRRVSVARAVGRSGWLRRRAGRSRSSGWRRNSCCSWVCTCKQAVKQLGEIARSKNSTPGEAPWNGDPLEQDFHAQQMQLQYDQEANCFVLHAFEGDENDPNAGAQTSVSFWMTMAQCSELAGRGAAHLRFGASAVFPVRRADRSGRSPVCAGEWTRSV